MAQVFDNVNRWTAEGDDQMLLLLDDTIIHGFRGTCNCLARKQLVARHRTERTVRASWRSQQSACNATNLMSRRRLTRRDRSNVKIVSSFHIEYQRTPYAGMRLGRDIAVSKKGAEYTGASDAGASRALARCLPRQAVRRFRSRLAFDEAAPNNRLQDERFSRTAGRCGPCATPRATCTR